MRRKYYITLGTVIVVIGLCALLLYSKQKDTDQRIEQTIARLRAKVQDNRARALREDSERARCAVGELWAVVNDQSQSVWRRMVDLAKLYHRGIFPYFKPDVDTGNALCRTVILYSPDAGAKTEARLLLFSLAERETTHDIHPKSRNFPIEPAGVLTRLAMAQKTARVVPKAAEPPKKQVIRRDSQNAHDHGVARHVSKILTSLPPATNAEGIRREVEEYIADGCGDHVSDDDRAAAIQFLESVRDAVDNPQLGISEQEALARVWRKAKHKDLVVQQLASGVEHGHPVCHSGKMARFAAALDDGESETRILPLWAIKEQLNAVAANVRRTVLESASDADIDAYNATDTSNLKERMTTQFKAKCNEFARDAGIAPLVMRAVVDEIVQFGF
jgi:type II secretory pathway pseudopilin PulG